METFFASLSFNVYGYHRWLSGHNEHTGHTKYRGSREEQSREYDIPGYPTLALTTKRNKATIRIKV
jgi:hypothetical protein